MTTIDLYSKPRDICQEVSDWQQRMMNISIPDFCTKYKKEIEEEIAGLGLNMRFANNNDIIPVYAFISRRFRIDLIHEISKYDIYRYIEFGHGLIVETKQKEIIGCLFEVGYDTPDRSSYSIRLGVDEKYSGNNLGKLVTMYSSLLAMERGSMVKRGLIDYDNHTNLYIQLNKFGWIIDDFYPELQGMGTCFKVCLPLNPKGMFTNAIDPDKLIAFIKCKTQGKDYLLIDTSDIDTIRRIYSNTSFRIVALIKKDILNANPLFFAIPAESMNFQIKNH